MAKPRLAQAARDDVRSIRSYSKAAFGEVIALDYVNGLRATLKRLGDRPLNGIAESDIGENMRSFGFRSHRIYYRHGPDGVLIVRILHQAQDARTILGNEH